MDARSRPGLTIHRATALDKRDLRCRHGLPVTSPARTIVDFAAEAEDLELEGALGYLFERRLATRATVEAAIERATFRAGVARLRALLDAGAPALSRSKAERLLRRLLKAAELPQPISNAKLLGHEVDFLWPQHRLVVEFDGYHVHGRRSAFEQDRRRDQRLVAAGYRVVRVTWRQLEREPYAVIARLAQALVAAA
jgi:very-short-patch-repair endonuclease